MHLQATSEFSPWWRRLVPVLAGVAVQAVVPAAAQEAVCPEGRVSGILIDNQSVFDLSETEGGRRFAWAYRLANRLHVRTDAEVIERELLFEVGDCYQIEQLRDSERLLRAFPFLADADVYGIREADGDIQVMVDTQDEWSTRVEPRIGSGGPAGLRGIRVVEDNLLGTGRHVSLFYERNDEDRIYGVAFATPQLFRSRWNMGVRLARTDVGYDVRQSVTYPFLGETGRIAFREASERQDRYFELFMPSPDGGPLSRILVPVRREKAEVGAAFRWGAERYRHTLLGVALATERVGYPAPPRQRLEDGSEVDASGMVGDWWMPVSGARLMLLTGQRNVYFVRRQGLDTVNGTEDVELGVEAEASFGPTLPIVSTDRDIAVGIGLFAAGELPGESLVGGRFAAEARRAYRRLPGFPEWHDIQSELEVWAYLRPEAGSRHQLVASVSAVGGWHSRAPFQLTLGGEAGLRGFPRHVHPGGRRIVGSVEHRARLDWPAPTLFDLGTVLFVDGGQIWRGHAPFGVDSGVRASVGAGIRAAFPAGSRQTFRLDVGMPMRWSPDFGDVVLRVGVGQAIGRGGSRPDPQLLRSARYRLGSADFIAPFDRP